MDTEQEEAGNGREKIREQENNIQEKRKHEIHRTANIRTGNKRTGIMRRWNRRIRNW